jgi:hypothetical protein
MTNYQEIADIIERRRIFLDDTISHYTTCNRSTKYDTGCIYAPAHANTAGCAIGRHLPIEVARELDCRDNTSIDESENFASVPVWMQQMGEEFLFNMQQLHDVSSHWDENGITESGMAWADRIRKKYINRNQ